MSIVYISSLSPQSPKVLSEDIINYYDVDFIE
jgi:hypothetical protein